MMPVKPPAASAKMRTAGNQNRRRIWRRCSGGAVTIAFGEYDFNFEPGNLSAIISAFFSIYDGNLAITYASNAEHRITCSIMPAPGNVESHSSRLREQL